MTKRKLEGHQECLAEFGARLKKEVVTNIEFWKSQDQEIAKQRASAFELILSELKKSAEVTGIPLQDIGVEDFNVPKVP